MGSAGGRSVIQSLNARQDRLIKRLQPVTACRWRGRAEGVRLRVNIGQAISTYSDTNATE